MGRYIVGAIISLGLIILLIVLLLGGSNNSRKVNNIYLPSYSSNPYSEVVFTQTGPIISNQTHNYLTISVNSSEVQFNLYRGYQNNIVASKIYNNNQTAYNAFLFALYYAGFTIGNNNPKLRNNTGYCSVGDVYTFELINSGRVLEKYWSTNCSSAPSTYGGQLSTSISLFKGQVPNYSQLTTSAIF